MQNFGLGLNAATASRIARLGYTLGTGPTWMMIVGLPALTAGTAAFVTTRSGPASVGAAIGGAVGGLIAGLILKHQG